MNMDINNYELGMPLGWYEYVRIPVSMAPDEITEEYNLYDMVHNGYLCMEVCKGMYGLPQAGLPTNLLLTNCLSTPG
jgi:hypothetical protein